MPGDRGKRPAVPSARLLPGGFTTGHASGTRTLPIFIGPRSNYATSIVPPAGIKLLKRISYGFRNRGVYVRKMLLAFLPLAWLISSPHFLT